MNEGIYCRFEKCSYHKLNSPGECTRSIIKFNKTDGCLSYTTKKPKQEQTPLEIEINEFV